jgi:hypothetical protein
MIEYPENPCDNFCVSRTRTLLSQSQNRLTDSGVYGTNFLTEIKSLAIRGVQCAICHCSTIAPSNSHLPSLTLTYLSKCQANPRQKHLGHDNTVNTPSDFGTDIATFSLHPDILLLKNCDPNDP